MVDRMEQRIPKAAALPRAELVQGVTPIEPLPRLQAELGGPRLIVKRDDCTGLHFGGNKTRQLEYYMGDAEAKGADTLLITGAVQSNFARSAAAAARRAGMDIHIQLEERVAGADDIYHRQGNVLLSKVMGAHLHHFPVGEDEAAADASVRQIAASVEDAGGRPYIIPLSPGHPPLGAVGYVRAAHELLTQIEAAGTRVDHVVVPSGSAATHSGLLLGLRALGSEIPVTGACVRRDASLQRARVQSQVEALAELLEMDNPVPPEDVLVDDAAFGAGYGRAGPEVVEAIALAAQCDGVLLDPVYSGKAMATLISLVRRGSLGADQTVLFMHTGGLAALFAYETLLAESFTGE